MEVITLGILANDLGLNKSTISRALRGDRRISQATIRRVVKRAEELGYRRNPSLAALSEIRWRRSGSRALMNWGFLVTDMAMRYAENPLLMDYLKKYSEEAGYSLAEIILRPETTAKSLSRLIDARSLQGMIVNQIYRPDAAGSLDFAAIKSRCVSWVYCGNFYFEPEGHRVVESAFANARRALTEMRAKGYRRIALICTNFLQYSRDVIRQRGAALEFQRSHPEMHIEIVEVGAEEYFGSLEGALDGCEALLLSYSAFHYRLPRALQQLPYADLRVRPNATGVSGIARLNEDVARTTVDLLDFLCRRFIQGLNNNPYTTLVEARWQEGFTLERDWQRRFPNAQKMTGKP